MEQKLRQTLNISGLNKIDRIFHISDIHIRKLQRHEEYESVFENLYQSIREKGTDNSLIFLGGDIGHTKIDVSNEQFDITSRFFNRLTELAPVIIIAGNHDALVNNNSRLDSISPIIDALNNDRIFYLKRSGIYTINDTDIDFVVWSALESRETYQSAKESTAKYKIVCYHGIIDSVVINNRMMLHNSISVHDFNGFDICLLGDIHQPLTMQEYANVNGKILPLVRYSSSLIQQDFGEMLYEHGYLIWNLKEHSNEFIRVKNDYGFYTINVVDGKYELMAPDELPKYLKIRIKSVNTSHKELTIIKEEIEHKYNPLSVIIDYNDNIAEKINIINKAINEEKSQAVSDETHQTNLINEYIDYIGYTIRDEVKDKIMKINSELLPQIESNEPTVSNICDIKKLEFSNLFSYGEDNVIDFTQLSGAVGVFGKNAIGKSSLLDILEYCFYDKCSRANKVADIINRNKMDFYCRVHFEINDRRLVIERRGMKKISKSDYVKVEVTVRFWEILPDGTEKDLTGDQRRTTNANIQNLISSLDNFELITASLQHKNTNFIDKIQSERKDMLISFFGITKYEQLLELSKEEHKRISVLLNELIKENIVEKIHKNEDSIENGIEKTKEISIKMNGVSEKISKKTKKYAEELSKKFPVEITVTDVYKLERDKKKLEDELRDVRERSSGNTSEIKELNEKLSGVTGKIDDIFIEDVNHEVEQLTKLADTYHSSLTTFKIFSNDLEHKKEKLKKFKNLEYDPNCSYCMNNVFVKDAIQTKEQIAQDLNQFKIYQTELSGTLGQIQDKKIFRELHKQYSELVVIKDDIESKIEKLELRNEVLKNQYETIGLKIEKVDRDIRMFYKNKEKIEHNEKIDDILVDISAEIKLLEIELGELNEFKIRLKSELIAIEKDNERLIKQNDKLIELHVLDEAYSYYNKIVSRNGIPYYLIGKVIIELENEVNSILSQIAKFTIKMEMNDKDIDIHIVYPDKNVIWPIELCSGMERFITSIAIRIALNILSSVPKFNFLIIDEGFGALDKDMIHMLPKLFDYLKYMFRFVLIISHLDTMHDMVDLTLPIDNSINFSSIKYS